MKISLIVTSQGNTQALYRLFDSLSKQINTPSKSLQIIFADQGNDKPVTCQFINDLNIVYKKIKPSSLSSARNQVLQYATGEILAFPDDDCWFNPVFFSTIVQVFNSDPQIALWICNIFDPSNNKYYGCRPVENVEINNKNIYYLPSSVGMFLNRSIIKDEDIYFNEDLGLGTRWGAGEDVELAFRIYKRYANCYYNGTKRVYHQVVIGGETMDKAYKYGLGSGALAAKLFLNNNYQHLWIYLKYVYRSLLGAIYYLFLLRKKAFFAYYSRFKGLITGFVMGFIYFKKSEKNLISK